MIIIFGGVSISVEKATPLYQLCLSFLGTFECFQVTAETTLTFLVLIGSICDLQN